MKRRTVLLVTAGMLLAAGAASANPSPGFEHYLFSTYWFIKTAPFNYAVDLIALFVALWASGQQITIAWRLVPVYNVMVFVAGYVADYAARGAVGMAPYQITPREQLVGGLADIGSGVPYAGVSLHQGAEFLAVAALLIFVFNLVIISVILRWNDADSYARLPLAAVIMAVLTAPYIAVRGEGAAAWIVPLLLAACALAIYYTVRLLHSRVSTCLSEAHDQPRRRRT